MSVIRILPEAVANKIAAGEVVERPVSIVKELLENSLDAGSTQVSVEVESGGKRLIRVTDNGCGMTHDDALLAFERHATSKIRDADDLFAIATLGFRGEALPSIAAVSRLLLVTRHPSEPAGTQIEFGGGRLRDVNEVAWPAGTRIEVRDLFFNTPARRKFLKSESTELGHIAGLVTHYALAHPLSSFRLASFSHEVLNVSPVGDLRSRVHQLLGGQTLEQLLEIAPAERAMPVITAPDLLEEDEPPEPPSVVRISGFVSRPEVQKLNRNQIYFFVNRRQVRDRLILHAITEAYRNILPASVFPVALIFLEVPFAEVDVNVHPSKTEVRFRHSQFIHDFARDAIRQVLVRSRPVAAFPPGKARPPGASAELDADAAERLTEEAPVIGGPPAPPWPVGAGARTGGHRRPFTLTSPAPPPRSGTLPWTGPMSGPSPSRAAATAPSPAAPTPSASSTAPSSPAPAAPRAEATAGLVEAEFPTDLVPLGQVEESFIVATNSEGLWIVDQHVAHERILFEKHLRLRRDKRVEGQRLLLPIVVELNPEQQAIFTEIAEELRSNGFDLEPFGARTVAIQTAPADIRAEDVEHLLLEILDVVAREARALSLEALRTRIAASVACHAAIKVHMRLERTKMDWLLRELAKTDCPMSCPHGRPVLLRYGLKEIQKAFKRI